jgi:hypothetical protein
VDRISDAQIKDMTTRSCFSLVTVALASVLAGCGAPVHSSDVEELVEMFLRANSRLPRRIDDVLGPRQLKKFDVLRHKAEVSVVHDG